MDTTTIILTPVAPTTPVGNSILGNLILFGNYLGLPETNLLGMTVHIIRLAFSFLGILFVLLIIIAGFNWMTSGGDEEKVGKAKKMIVNAIIGLILILSAYSIVQFVIGAVLNQSTTNTTTY